MNYTTNYHLPQWVETDRIQMEHFNQAFSDIDEGLSEGFSPNNKPYVTGTFNMTVPNTSGAVVLTLNFQPSHILLSSADVMLIRQGAGGSVHAVTGDSERSYFMAFSLQGNQLKYGSSGSSLSGTMTLGYVAYR